MKKQVDIDELETLTEKQAETIRQLNAINQILLNQNRTLTRRLKQDTVPLKAIESACFNFFKMMEKDGGIKMEALAKLKDCLDQNSGKYSCSQ